MIKGVSSFQALMLFFGAGNNMDIAWSLADITMGLEAVVNIVAIFLLSHIAIDCLKDYEKQKKQGKDPVFFEGNIGLTNTDVWQRGRSSNAPLIMPLQVL